MPTVFNTDTPKPGYVYDSTVDTWFPLAGIAPGSSVDRYYFLATSGATAISGVDENGSTLAYDAGTEQVFLNGVLLVRNADYTATNGTSVTAFSPALSTNDVVEIVTYNPSNIEKTNAILETSINAKGDLIAGLADNSAGILSTGTNGQYLKVDTSTATGLTWDTSVVTLTGTQTLTNKTLTSPVLGGTTTTASGNLVVEPATFILEVKGGGATVGQIQLNCPVNSHGQIIASQPHSEAATNTLTLPGGSTIGNANATLVSDTGIQTLTNKTLTNPILVAPEERLTVTAASATGTINIDTATAGTLYYTNSASSNHTINVRHSSNTSLNNTLTTGDSVTVVWLNTNGATAYYPSLLLIDSATSGVSVKYQGGTAYSSGNASSVDAYVYNIIKTGSAAFTVLASQTKFA